MSNPAKSTGTRKETVNVRLQPSLILALDCIAQSITGTRTDIIEGILSNDPVIKLLMERMTTSGEK